MSGKVEVSAAVLDAANADAMFGKNRMKEAGFDVDGDGVVEADELLDLQRLNYATPGGLRRGEMQVPAGGFSRYAHSMTNKAKAERVRREQQERQFLGSPHLPKGTLVTLASGEVGKLTAWEGSDLISGEGTLQPMEHALSPSEKQTGEYKPTRVFVGQKKSDARLKNHETKDRAKFTSKVALPKMPYPPSGTVNTRSPLSGSHSSDAFGDAHDAFTKDEHIEQARLHALTGKPQPKEAATAEEEARQRAALSWMSRASVRPPPLAPPCPPSSPTCLS